MRLLVNSMGCEKCRPAYRELVREFIYEHEADMCEECNHRAEINPCVRLTARTLPALKSWRVLRESPIIYAMIAASITKP